MKLYVNGKAFLWLLDIGTPAWPLQSTVNNLQGVSEAQVPSQSSAMISW